MNPPQITATQPCGICGALKDSHSYTAPLKTGGVIGRTVLLCRHCDLTPQPPVGRPA